MSTNELIEQNMKLAYKLANQYNIRFNHKVDIEDLKSICLIGLVKAAQSYNENLNFTFATYAYRVIKNEIVHEYKKNLIQPHKSLSENIGDDLELGDTIEDEKNIFEDIENQIDNEYLKKHIMELDELHRSIVLMTLNKYTRKEIAERLNISEKKVNTEYYKAISILRRRMKK